MHRVLALALLVMFCLPGFGDTILLTSRGDDANVAYGRLQQFTPVAKGEVKLWRLPEYDAIFAEGSKEALKGLGQWREMVGPQSPAVAIEVSLLALPVAASRALPGGWHRQTEVLKSRPDGTMVREDMPAVRSLPGYVGKDALKAVRESGKQVAGRGPLTVVVTCESSKTVWLEGAPPAGCDPKAIAVGLALQPMFASRGDLALRVALVQALPDPQQGVRVEKVFELHCGGPDGESLVVALTPGSEPPETGEDLVAVLTPRALQPGGTPLGLDQWGDVVSKAVWPWRTVQLQAALIVAPASGWASLPAGSLRTANACAMSDRPSTREAGSSEVRFARVNSEADLESMTKAGAKVIPMGGGSPFSIPHATTKALWIGQDLAKGALPVKLPEGLLVEASAGFDQGVTLQVTWLQPPAEPLRGTRANRDFMARFTVSEGQSLVVALRPGAEPPKDGQEALVVLTPTVTWAGR